MVALVAFDLDGTLVDSRRDITDAANALLVADGAEPLSESRIGRMVGEGAAVLVERAFAAAGRPAPMNALARYLELYEQRLLAHTRPYPGVREALETLAGRVPLAVLTNKPLRATRAVLDGLDLSRYFDRDAVLGGDGPCARKPDPGGLLHLAARAGAAAHATVLVGDSLIDWKTAHAAGARVCLARYGFGFEAFPPDRLASADLAVDAAADLPRVLDL